jgi:3-oxoacyl-[acyl-carrier-protein] synthase II
MTTGSSRIVITGMGLISPIGSSVESLWKSLQTGKSGVRALELVPPDAFPTNVGGQVADFTGSIDDFGELDKTLKRSIKKGLKLMCREIEMGVASAQVAMLSAGLRPGTYDPERIGTLFGSDYIMTLPDEFVEGVSKCINSDGSFQFEDWAKNGLHEVEPLWLLKYLPNMPASHVAIYNDLRGPSNSLTMRESSSNLAIAESMTTLRRGNADIIVAGSTGSRIHPLRTVHIALQEKLAKPNGKPESASRPFDLNRTGMVLGEGAASVVLETLQSAEKRGVEPLVEILGYGSSTVLSPDGRPGIAQAMINAGTSALRSAGLQSKDIDHVNAHGLSCKFSDTEEATAINRLFADRPVPVVALKSFMGNLGAGSGMVELIASVKAMHEGNLFRTLNYETPDPDCNINVVTDDSFEAGQCFLNLNTTPQGQASAIIARLVK